MATANAGHATRLNIGQKFKTDTSSVVGATSHALDQTIVAHNATDATSDVTASNGCLDGAWINTTAKDTVRGCTDCHNAHTNPQSSNMKITSNTTKGTLQPYSQEELNEIAANVLEYQRKHCMDYTYTNERQEVITTQAVMTPLREAQLMLIAKDLYRRGEHKPKAQAEFTSQVIGTTIC